MSNYITDIQLSGVTYTLSAQTSGGSGATVTELTQAAYDALVSAGTVNPDVFYIITDATPIDVSNFWTTAQTQSAITQATSGKVDSSSIVTSVTSASTDSDIPTAKAVYDAIPTGGTGGGKAISAGTNISVTTGETTDTISCTLPITSGQGGNSVLENEASYAWYDSHAEGWHTEASGQYSHAEGFRTIASGICTHSEGADTKAYNSYEHTSGCYNVSNKASKTFGDSGNTLFSVGNGTAENARHNAFEIRQNGDIYFYDGANDVKLQDKFTGIETTIGNINSVLSSI